jgi:hypothetical protein
MARSESAQDAALTKAALLDAPEPVTRRLDDETLAQDIDLADPKAAREEAPLL